MVSPSSAHGEPVEPCALRVPLQGIIGVSMTTLREHRMQRRREAPRRLCLVMLCAGWASRAGRPITTTDLFTPQLAQFLAADAVSPPKSRR